MNRQLTLGSLFSGSGGFELAGYFCGIKPVWASEIEPFPIRVTTKRMPFVQHLGDIRAIDGAKIPPVDIIAMGSPCTNLSLAGKREGLTGKESSLFFEAIRIIKEMRKETKNDKPRYIVWENVAGAFSSNQGEDFRRVLSEIVQIAEPGAEVPACGKNGWPHADVLMGTGWSVAYRLVDAQHFGVAQRRRRVYLVADFGSERAGDILFEREGVRRDFAQGFRAWENTAGTPAGGAGGAISFEPGALKRLGRGVNIELSSTLRASTSDNSPPAVAIDNHPADSRVGVREDGVVQTLPARMGTGGGNVPLAAYCLEGNGMRPSHGGNGVNTDVAFTLNTIERHAVACAEHTMAFGICSCGSNAMKSPNPHAGIYEADTARTLDANGGNPGCNQGGMAVVSYAMTTGSYADVSENLAHTLQARDYKSPQITNNAGYIVRRLTPTECAVLQGFPCWWCSGLETPKPTEADIAFWTEVWETHRLAIGKSKKPKSRNQIVKWLQHPHSDSAEYKLWGNGIALPCALFVMQGIADRGG